MSKLLILISATNLKQNAWIMNCCVSTENYSSLLMKKHIRRNLQSRNFSFYNSTRKCAPLRKVRIIGCGPAGSNSATTPNKSNLICDTNSLTEQSIRVLTTTWCLRYILTNNNTTTTMCIARLVSITQKRINRMNLKLPQMMKNSQTHKR